MISLGNILTQGDYSDAAARDHAVSMSSAYSALCASCLDHSRRGSFELTARADGALFLSPQFPAQNSMPPRTKKAKASETPGDAALTIPQHDDAHAQQQQSLLERLPAELLGHICTLMVQRCNGQICGTRELYQLRQASRLICRAASTCINRSVTLRGIERAGAFLALFNQPRRSLKRNQGDVSSYSPLAAYLTSDVRAVVLHEARYSPSNRSAYKLRMERVKFHDQLEAVLPMLANLGMLEWHMAHRMPHGLLQLLAKIDRFHTLFIEEKFAHPPGDCANPDVYIVNSSDTEKKDRYLQFVSRSCKNLCGCSELAQRTYPANLVNFQLHVFAVGATHLHRQCKCCS